MQKSFSPIEFLLDRGEFCNQHGVSIMLMHESSVHIACDYPDTPCPDGYALEIVKLYQDEDAFLGGLRIGSKIELNTLSPLDMLLRYEDGEMDVSCLVERDRVAGVLIFHKDKGALLAIDEDRGQSHRVDEDLRFGPDYIAYTVAYFHL